MTPKQNERLRKVLLFVIVWELVVFAVRALAGAVGHVTGLVGVLLASLAVAYCRWRARRGLPPVKRTPMSYVWLYLPSVPALLSTVGLVVKFTHPGPKPGLVGFVRDLLPVLLQLVVPIAPLTYAYVVLLRDARPRPPASD